MSTDTYRVRIELIRERGTGSYLDFDDPALAFKAALATPLRNPDDVDPDKNALPRYVKIILHRERGDGTFEFQEVGTIRANDDGHMVLCTHRADVRALMIGLFDAAAKHGQPQLTGFDWSEVAGIRRQLEADGPVAPPASGLADGQYRQMLEALDESLARHTPIRIGDLRYEWTGGEWMATVVEPGNPLLPGGEA